MSKEFEIKQEYKDKILQWYEEDIDRIFIISGYAGCGKTTLARKIPELLDLKGSTVFLAPTGKAAKVIGRGARTIHSLLYIPEDDGKGRIVRWIKRPPTDFEEYDLLIVDEISMVSDEMLMDLRDTKVPIIGLGDPAQLPPVNGTNTILDEPDIFLTQVWRNDGGVLALATDIRMKNRLSWKYENVTLKFTGIQRDLKLVDEDSIIICKFNNTRQQLNHLYRKEIRGYNLLLQVGEKLIVTRNNKTSGLMNGSIVVIEEITKIIKDALLAELVVRTDEDYKLLIKVNLDTIMRREVRPFREPTIHDVDYAYAITCHKAQGSEYEKVFVVNEGRGFDGHQSWLYTAVTRAKKEVHIYN